MQYIEPHQATITIVDEVMSGILSGSTDAVKFVSNDETFLKYFPNGSFDTLFINEDACTQTQQDIIAIARELVRRALPH